MHQKQALGLVWGVSDGNKTSQGGLTEAGRDGGVWGLMGGGVMITENKKATVVRPPLRPASNYTHRHIHTHTWGLPIWPSGCC